MNVLAALWSEQITLVSIGIEQMQMVIEWSLQPPQSIYTQFLCTTSGLVYVLKAFVKLRT